MRFNGTSYQRMAGPEDDTRIEWRAVATIALVAIIAFGLARGGANLMLRADDLGSHADSPTSR